MNILNLIHCLFLLLSQLLLIASGCVGDVECLPDQRSLLLELKRGFNSTEILTTWLPDTNCCSWEGITCNSETGQVIGLDLSFHTFPGGNISYSLFKLTSLHTLNFAYSSFSDDLPIPQSGFEKLVDLTQLNLSNAGLVGQIPIGISQLTRLTTLDLSNCYSEGNAYLISNPNLTTLIRNLSNLRELYLDCVDIYNDNNWSSAVSISLPRLQVLSLSGCNLPGLLNHDIFELKNLMVLDLSGNWMLSGVLPKHFSKANTLKSLVLSRSNISGNLPVSIGNLKNLTRLDISYNMMAGTIPSSIGNLTELVYLDLSWNNFRGLLNNDIFQLKNLMVLDLSGNSMLSGVLPKHFSKASTLKSLVLSDTNIPGSLPDSIGNLKNLTRLDISYNMMAGTIPSSIGNLTKLVHLDISGNNFSGMIPPTIGKVVQLEHLDLSSNTLGGMIPSSVGNLTNLVHLNLMSNGISGEIPSSIRELSKLVDLDLSYNSLGGMIPSSVGNLTNLVHLNLMSNGISGEIPSSIGKLHKLVDLTLSDNNLSGSVPPFVPWAKIQYLDLSRNNIGGSFPSSMFCLPALQQLILTNNQLSELEGVFSCPLTQLWYIDLSHNQLQGAIPMSLFKLSALQTLYIASNNFSGTVEMDMFESLKDLTYLDISNNKLTIGDTNGYYNPSFPKFQELNFASCNLTKIPAFLRYQYTIRRLDLSNNRISGDIPKWLWSVGNESLTTLNLSCNLFTHLEGPTELSTIKLLESLDLHSNKLQGPIPLPPKSIDYFDYSDNNFSSIIPSSIFSSSDISYISLANNRLTGDIPRSICGFLSVVDLSNNSLSGSIPSCFFELGVLNLRGNQLQGIIPQTNGECQLRTLILSDNNLEGQLPRSLVNCSDLEVLDVGNNHIKDSFPFWLANFVNLRVLILKENEFYGPVELPENHEAKYTFPKLQLFDLSANHFSGNLSSKYFSGLTLMMRNSKLNYSAAGLVFPFAFNGSSTLYRDSITITIRGIKYALGAELSIFMSIDFSNNGFEGTIPDAIGELQGLHRLNLSNNALKGGIPSTIRNLKQLESLDLSGNHLSGLIPLELTSLTFLSFLNLSNNNLTGKIPQANQLSTFSNSSFLGNPGLCGTPLSKQCDSVNNRNDTRTTILKPDHSSRNYVIGLALFTGLGFGVGFAMAIVLQNVPLKSWIRKATAARN